MTYFEIRCFKDNEYCFKNLEITTFKKAKEIFDRMVLQIKMLHAKKEISSDVYAHKIQLVERNNNMTWLVEHDIFSLKKEGTL